MNLYSDFIPLMAGEDGVIRGPAGDGRLAAVARADVAEAAAAVLAGEGHGGETYDPHRAGGVHARGGRGR